jgi:hypothetical protein
VLIYVSLEAEVERWMIRVTSLIIYSKLLSLSDEAHIHALKPTDDETPRFTADFELRIL